MTLPVTLLTGNPRPGSRTGAIARRVTDALCAGLAAEGLRPAGADHVDLAELGPLLPARASSAVPNDGRVDRALALVGRPGLLVVASPTFKGSYSGILKLFLDMIPFAGLGPDTVAVAVMTAGWPHHRFVADLHLRALLVELGAQAPIRSLCILEDEFGELETVTATWTAQAAPTLAAVLHRQRGGPAPAALPHQLADTQTVAGAISTPALRSGGNRR